MSDTMRQIPSSSALNDVALATARRCGVDASAVAGDVVTTSPINGERLAGATWSTVPPSTTPSRGRRPPSCSGAEFRPLQGVRWSSGSASF